MGRKNAAMVLAERMAENIVASQVHARLQISADAACIAANETFNMGPKRAPEFCRNFIDALNWLSGLYVDDCDSNKDKQIEYAKGKRDEVMKKFMGDAFSSFDDAYGNVYFDEGKRIRGDKR